MEKGSSRMRYINNVAFNDACLFAFQGVQYKEIAVNLNVPPTTLSNLVLRED